MSTPSLILVLSAVTVGVGMFVVGRRGRLIDDHPVCGRCRFDLSGRPDGGGRCPECGASLDGPKAVRIGNRRRRGGLIYAGLTLLLAGGLPLTANVALAVTGYDPLPVTPTWLLFRDLNGGTELEKRRAAAELNARLRRGDLTAADQRRLVAVALRLQADLSTRWNPDWGDLIEWLHGGGGAITAAEWAAYLAHLESATLEVDPQVRRGEPIHFRVTGQLRAATAISNGRAVHAPECGVRIPGIDPQPVDLNSVMGVEFHAVGEVDLPRKSWQHLAAGRHEMVVQIDGIDCGLGADPTLFAPLVLRSTWTLVDNGRPAAKP